MGEGDLVDTVLAALGGDFGRLKAYSGAYRAEIIEALGNAISWRSDPHPANALAEIHAVEALPRLREVLRNLGGRNPTGEAVAAVISRLPGEHLQRAGQGARHAGHRGRPSSLRSGLCDQGQCSAARAARRVRRLFDNEKIRHLIDAQPRIRLSVKGHDGWLSKFPAGVDELYFQAAGVIKDLAQLQTLFDLFAEILQQVCHEGKAYEDDVRIHMRRLRAPGGRIRDKHVLWEGDEPRRAAAAALGRLGDPEAVPALVSVLGDEDAWLRAQAIDALAEIRHQDAVGPLIPLLGDTRAADDRSVQGRVAEALRQLGEGELVDTVLAALIGDFGRLKALGGGYRAEIVAALTGALKRPSGTHAANALAEIHAVEALPRLREVLRSRGAQNPAGQAVSRAIRKLEARASLPRAASAADVEVDTLPRAAREPGPESTTLPRGSRAPSD